MPLVIDKEAKTVVRNEYATVVIVNGATHLVEVRRPGDERKNSEYEKTRDLKFPSLQTMEDFLVGATEAYFGACKELGNSPRQFIPPFKGDGRK